MCLDITSLSAEELRQFIASFRIQLPKDASPLEPPDNAWNGYWKHCSVCRFEHLFPGSPQGDPAVPYCRHCSGKVIWKRPQDIHIMSEPELREYFTQLDRRLNRTVFPKSSRTSNYFKECGLCEYRFLRPRRGDLLPDNYCEHCGSKIIWPT